MYACMYIRSFVLKYKVDSKTVQFGQNRIYNTTSLHMQSVANIIALTYVRNDVF